MSARDPRRVALEVLLRVENGGSSDRALDRALGDGRLTRLDRGLVTEIVYGVLRRRGSIDRALRRRSRRRLDDLDAAVRVALRIGAYQILCLDRVPSHAAVNATVEAVKPHGRAGAAGYVNGVLRGLLRTADASPQADVFADVPAWWAERWVQRYGERRAAAWFEASLRPSPLLLRAHPQALHEAILLERLADEGVVVEPAAHVPGAWRVIAGNPMDSPLLRDGVLALRGEASQLVASLLPVQPGDRVLDACAGRGGKTLQIAADAAPALTVANDIAAWRGAACQRGARAAGLGARVYATVADMATAAPFAAAFDAVLVDAPCSGLGTVRRRPELKWRTSVEDVQRLAELQAGIVAGAAAVLRPGGVLLYATCSTEPEENERVVERATAAGGQLELRPVELPEGADPSLVGADGFFRTYPNHSSMDGFFAALLTRVG